MNATHYGSLIGRRPSSCDKVTGSALRRAGREPRANRTRYNKEFLTGGDFGR
jgi:hypothetical protein